MNKVFFDTNVLVSAIDTTRANHKKAYHLMQHVKNKELKGYISTQIIGEYYVGLTRSRGGLPAPLTVKEAKDELDNLISLNVFNFISINEPIIQRAINLCAHYEIKGVKFWDTVIIASIIEHNIQILYTENFDDFKKFTHLVEIIDLYNKK